MEVSRAMTMREAACSCGQLRVTCEGEPVRISICHCIACQRRTGSVFGAQARFPRDKVRIEGQSKTFTRVAESGNTLTFHFCPDCGTTVHWSGSGFPDLVAVAMGAFADPSFPPPRHSVYESKRHSWALHVDALPLEHI
jgi:hypothetical protein